MWDESADRAIPMILGALTVALLVGATVARLARGGGRGAGSPGFALGLGTLLAALACAGVWVAPWLEFDFPVAGGSGADAEAEKAGRPAAALRGESLSLFEDDDEEEGGTEDDGGTAAVAVGVGVGSDAPLDSDSNSDSDAGSGVVEVAGLGEAKPESEGEGAFEPEPELLARAARPSPELAAAIAREVDAANREGTAAALSGRWDEALEAFELALRLDPGNAKAHYNRAMIHYRRDRPRAALEDFNAALAREPDFHAARVSRATVHLRLGDRASARADVERVLEREPGHPAATRLRERLVEVD